MANNNIKIGDKVKFNVYYELCCEVCNQIIYNYIDCPICNSKDGYESTEQYEPLYGVEVIECSECKSQFKRTSDKEWYCAKDIVVVRVGKSVTK